MVSLLARTTSSQRWAASAMGLALLFACSPQPAEEPATPALSESKVEAPLAPATAPVTRATAETEPGYAGAWALVDADCAAPARTFKLSGERIDMTPGERSCKVTDIASEAPSGRSMIYTVKADCLTEGKNSQDVFKLNFGASDTVMQLQLNDRDPVRLTRCSQ